MRTTGAQWSRRYIRTMRSISMAAGLWILSCGLAFAADPARTTTTAEIAEETIRNFRGQNQLVTFWWLPAEYWVQAAREAGKSASDLEKIEALYGNYNLVGVMDVKFSPDGKVDSLSTAEIVRRLEVFVNDVPFDILRQVDPKLQELAPELSYAFRVSLAEFGRGLRLLPLPNVDAKGQPILEGGRPGVLRVRYKAAPTGPPLEFWWHAPLTAVKGAGKCPGSLAPTEASWTHCPWSGKPVE